ncbi:MAG: hypothetical protein AB1846_14370 [Chloroflexota bacterium]
MKPKTRLLALLALLLLVTSACQSSADDFRRQVATAVAATVAAQPVPTAAGTQAPYTPYPTFTPYPTAGLAGLFCGYEFCIGHPVDLSFIDAVFTRDQAGTSNYAYGIILAFRPNLFLQVQWTLKAGEARPYAMLDLAKDRDASLGSLQVDQFGEAVATYDTLVATSSSELPHGVIATWECADREFGWKVYTPQDGQGVDILREALERFDCSPR